MQNKALALLACVMLVSAVVPETQAQPPSTLPFSQGGQFRLSVSNTDPNMIFIPGDRVTAISASAGMLTDRRTTGAGGVLFATVATKPFTLYVETALGQTLSVIATPVKGEGRVYRLVSAEPPVRPEARAWETAQPYEQLLVSLSRSVLTGKAPDGYGVVAPLTDGLKAPAGLQLTAEKAWAGDLLRADRYRVSNPNPYGLALREQDFWQPGVRAVMFDNSALSLMGGASTGLTVIRATGEGRNGKSQ